MDLPVRMSDGEGALFQRQLATATHYLEFGCGGSTLLAVRSPARVILSVESDPAWIGKIQQHPEIAAAVAGQRFSFKPHSAA